MPKNLGERKLEAAISLAHAYRYLNDRNGPIKYWTDAWWRRQEAARIIMDNFYSLLKLPLYEFMPEHPANEEEE